MRVWALGVICVALGGILPTPLVAQSESQFLEQIFGGDQCVHEAEQLAVRISHAAQMVNLELDLYKNDKSTAQRDRLCAAFRDVLHSIAVRRRWEQTHSRSCRDAPARSRQELAAEERETAKIRQAERRLCNK